ncbi:Ribonuclease H-like superfamily [Sesbania bispinosa]|nr:Ribonuclease H-like superfamily [Sesbania bispinosa]
MRTGSLIFSLLQVPGFRIHNLANYRDKALHSIRRTYGSNSSIRLLGSRIYWLEGGLSNKWNQRFVATKAEGSKHITGNTKSKSSKHEILSEAILTSGTTTTVNKTQLDQFQTIQCPEVQEIAQYKNLSDLVTVIVFDLETTGYNKVNERIVEIALRDLRGGENSTFQTLVNPQRYVPNSHIHGITTNMVNSPDVPRKSLPRDCLGGYLTIAHH